jgi:glycosyltransferase involved in cell wall biosynthesis
MTGKPVKLSVVIPCYNAISTLSEQLDALSEQQWSEPWEVIFVNNKCTDYSLELAESYRLVVPNLRIVHATERQGSAYALNVGIEAAEGEFIILCDADDKVGEGWVEAMAKALEQHELIACRMDTKELNPPYLQGHDQENGLQKIWYPPWLPHAGSGTLGLRKSVFRKVRFDERLPHLHDADFCFRAQMAGFQMTFVPNAVLHVRRRDSAWGNYLQSRNYAEYNGILARKYWPENQSRLGFYKIFIRDWLNLVSRLNDLRTKAGRFSWMWLCGRQIGRTKGILLRGGIPV